MDGAGAEERVMLALVRGKLRNIAEGVRDGGAPEREDTEDTPKIEGSLTIFDGFFEKWRNSIDAGWW